MLNGHFVIIFYRKKTMFVNSSGIIVDTWQLFGITLFSSQHYYNKMIKNRRYNAKFFLLTSVIKSKNLKS